MEDITIPFKKGSMNDIEASGTSSSQTEDEIEMQESQVSFLLLLIWLVLVF